MAADNSGNIIFSDTVNSLLRVIYSGGANAAANPMYAAIVANNPTITAPVAGNVYLIAGGAGGATPTTTAVLGTSVTLPNQVFKVTVGPNGNLYFGDSSASQVFFYDVSTGFIRVLFKSNTACAAHVTGATNGDGCPDNQFTISGSNGFGIAVDPLGNLYAVDSTNSLIRKIEAVSLIPTTVGSTTAAGAALTRTVVIHNPVGTTSMTATTVNAAADVTVGAVTCPTANTDGTLDCSFPVTFTPTQPGTRTADVTVQALNGGGNLLGGKTLPISGTAVGTVLVTDGRRL